MVDYLDSPVPYIIGLSEAIWNRISMSKWNELSDDTVAFHIDTGLLMTKMDMPPSPEPHSTILTETLNDLI